MIDMPFRVEFFYWTGVVVWVLMAFWFFVLFLANLGEGVEPPKSSGRRGIQKG